MQRKQLLKGQVYLAGRTLVRVLDTTASPVKSEIYDLIGQTWIPTTTQPRDIDRIYAPSRLSELEDASEAINAADRRRYILAVIDYVNEEYGTKIEVELTRREFNINIRISGQNNRTVSISTHDLARLVGPSTPLPASGSLHLEAQAFVDWASRVLSIIPPVVAGIEPLPGVKPEYLNAQALREAREVADALEEKIDQANRIESDVLEREVKVIEALGKDAVVKTFGRTWISWYNLRDLPEYQAKVDEALAAVGLSREYLKGGRFSLPTSKTLAELLEYAATL